MLHPAIATIAAQAAAVPTCPPSSSLTSAVPTGPDPAALLAAGERLATLLGRGQAIDARLLRAAMEAACGGSDAEGRWGWKDAYEACEAAQVLFLSRFGPALRAQPPAARLAMLARLSALLPTHTRRSVESESLQQFSTPIPLGLVAACAAAITPQDVVLEPSAGTGLLAVFAGMTGARLALNEIGLARAGLLARLFPDTPVTRFDAAQIDDHLDPGVRPSVVLMNPPFSVAAAVEGRVADAAWRHLTAALARLAPGGRLVAITGAGLAPDSPAWRGAFVRLQAEARVVFSAAVDGRAYARHGTTTETRLTIIDRRAADDPAAFPPSPGTAPDAATLLAWVLRAVPPRLPVSAGEVGRDSGRSATPSPSDLGRVVGAVRRPVSPRPVARAPQPEHEGVPLAYDVIERGGAEARSDGIGKARAADTDGGAPDAL